MTSLQHTISDSPERKTYFADVLLPIPIPQTFTYRVPRQLENLCNAGTRVIVQFGKNKILTGIIANVHHSPPEVYEAKYLLEVLDEFPAVQPIQLKLFEWMASYYMCTQGEVLNTALPSGLKLSSQSSIQLHPEFDPEEIGFDLTDKENKIIDALFRRGTLTYDEAADVLQIKSIYPTINSLIKKEIILIFEKIVEKYKPKKISKIRLSRHLVEDEKALELVFDQLAKKQKQTEILLKYLQEIPIYHHPEKNLQGLAKSAFNAENFSPSSLKTLIKNGIFEQFDEIVSRFEEKHVNANSEFTLSALQQNAKEDIQKLFESKDITLLHGITGSGKTEIYVELIKTNLEYGQQVLFLLPEIALTTQIVKRLMKIFGSTMGVYHSKYSDNERVEVWNGVISGKISFVVGVRSSVFLPFDNLGLIIIDEEHESSYKQFESAPRYQARDVALMLAQLHHAKVLMGSATPSIESFSLANLDKFGLVSINERYGAVALPEFIVVDVLREKKKKKMKEDFSPQLLDAIGDCLHQNEQVIIFQNRRGYAPYLACGECNWIPKCDSCSVSLTYHMYQHQLKCHYCGHKEKPPTTCPACGSTKMQTVGFGTEKLEEDLKSFFPEATIRRMDLDTTRSKYSYQQILDDFEKGITDILVGTQMLSKGLDFDNVRLVGVLDIDRMMNFPDFRSIERSFQLVTQVSGRAGRRDKKGMVMIQTAHPEHPLIRKIVNHDYQGMYKEEMIEREKFKYPPFVRLIKIVIKHADKQKCQKAAQYLFNLLRQSLGDNRVYGPAEPVISKIRNQYLMEILIKIERKGVNLKKAKEVISTSMLSITTDKQFKGIRIKPDVDPY